MDKKLNLAFCLFKYVPFGGLQVNFMNISKECVKRGYKIDVYTISWEGQRPEWLNITIVPVSGFTNHKKYQSFARIFNEHYKNKKDYDAVVGFNKMPGLDVYYAADVLYAAKMKDRSIFHRITSRYNTLMKLEHSVFRQDAKTQILLLTPKEKQFYKDYYKTSNDRFHIMPPGISRNCIPPANHGEIRTQKRNELNIAQDKNIILMVCINFKIKGVDRSIRALSSLPENILSKSVLLVAGSDNPRSYKRLAKKKISDRVEFIGARKDVPALLMASDLLLHPARIENTGTVIVEALAANLPVITTDICGYGFHVKSANAGKVIKSPFMQNELDKALLFLLTSKKQNQWRKNAKNYIEKTDVFSRAQRAVDIIEKVCS